MANPVQWTVDQFYAQLQAVKNQITAADAALQADKLRLQGLYTAARQANNTAEQTALTPQIHQNSVLRLSYLKPIKDDFNSAVNAASSGLRAAGLTVPNLSGLGILPAAVLVPIAAATFLAACITAIVIVNRLTAAQVNRTATIASLFSNPNTTAAEKLALAQQLDTTIKTDAAANPPPFSAGSFVLPLALVALIILGPQILRMLPARRATA